MGLVKSVIWMPAILLGSFVIFTAVAGEPTSEDRATVLSVGSEKQLFIDRLFFDTARDVTLKIYPARKTAEMNVERDRPWESVTLNWFSVLEDGGKYRMWYECYDADGWFGANDTSFCYAESVDGIH